MVKVLMGYDLAPGCSEARHDRWLREIHLPDMLRVPGLQGIFLNTTRQVVFGDNPPGYIAEMHYPDMDTYLTARNWIRKNPFPLASLPKGKIEIKFMLVCESDDLKDSSV